MRIAVLSPGYPSEPTPYNYAFVHARCRLYLEAGDEVAAFSVGAPARYELDRIPVTTDVRERLITELGVYRPDVIALHAPNFRTIPVARAFDVPQVSWVHGHEALFNLRGVAFATNRRERVAKWVKVVPRNLLQLATVRDFLRTQRHVVFVSKWMQQAAERNTLRRYGNAVIVPNPVDTRLFDYAYDANNLAKAVTARSLSSRKYGLDVAIRAFVDQRHAELDIWGKGSMEPVFRELISNTGSRTRLISEGVAHRDMPALFSRYGFFVAPSRVEAQGVAMCEAMAVGLPVVATRVGGIPEFVDHEVEGLLVSPENPRAMRAAVERLVADPERALRWSRAARERMQRQCSAPVVAKRERELLSGAD